MKVRKMAINDNEKSCASTSVCDSEKEEYFFSVVDVRCNDNS